jgi:hypothetical protein
MYHPYAQEAYKLGLALRQMTKSDDLVVTMANAIGDPVVIYYSQRRGWIFPPVGSGKTWTQLPEDDNKAIRLLDGLRAQGAGWLGIVNEHRDDIWKNHPLLAEYIEHTCELKQESPEWVIYRILPPE